MTVVTIPRQRATAAARHSVTAVETRTAWGRTIVLTVVVLGAAILVQQSLVDALGWASNIPGLVLAGLVAWGGGR